MKKELGKAAVLKREILAVFLEKHGRQSDREYALKSGFEVGKTYTMTNFEQYDWYTDIMFKEIPGRWNSVMFDFDQDAALKIWGGCEQ